jgi:hypothetical protein
MYNATITADAGPLKKGISSIKIASIITPDKGGERGQDNGRTE